MGGGKAIAGIGLQGRATLPSPPPPLAPGYRSLGTSGHLAGFPTTFNQQGIGWLLGQS